jgi:hypothetical protein
MMTSKIGKSLRAYIGFRFQGSQGVVAPSWSYAYQAILYLHLTIISDYILT